MAFSVFDDSGIDRIGDGIRQAQVKYWRQGKTEQACHFVHAVRSMRQTCSFHRLDNRLRNSLH